MVTHRGNLNYQDCRRILLDGYSNDAPDLLAEKAEEESFCLVCSVVVSFVVE